MIRYNEMMTNWRKPAEQILGPFYFHSFLLIFSAHPTCDCHQYDDEVDDDDIGEEYDDYDPKL